MSFAVKIFGYFAPKCYGNMKDKEISLGWETNIVLHIVIFLLVVAQNGQIFGFEVEFRNNFVRIRRLDLWKVFKFSVRSYIGDNV